MDDREAYWARIEADGEYWDVDPYPEDDDDYIITDPVELARIIAEQEAIKARHLREDALAALAGSAELGEPF